MIKEQRVLAVIPARGGSKGLSRKNLLPLGDKPLIAWTILAALQSQTVDRVVVSTDDAEIATVAKEWGAEVPFMRPPELATDNTPGVEPILHTIDMIPDFEWVIALQPTSPFRLAQDIDSAMAKCIKHQASSCVSVCETSSPPQWLFGIGKGQRLHPLWDGPLPLRRQEAITAYQLNGAIYVASIPWLTKEKRLIGADTLAHIMPIERSLDIDNAMDMLWANFLMDKI